MDYNDKLATSFLIFAGWSCGCQLAYHMISGNVFLSIVTGIVTVIVCATPYIISHGDKK